jgi:hypothetical protein
MPPTTQSIKSEKPEGISWTWKPKLVNTPVPIISAAASARAVIPDTLGRSNTPPALEDGAPAAASCIVVVASSIETVLSMYRSYNNSAAL